MKKILTILLLLCIIIIPIGTTAQETYKQENPVKITAEMVKFADELRDNAKTVDELKFAIKMDKMISNPLYVSTGLDGDPNGQYNYGSSVYERIKTDSAGIAWKRVGYK